MCDCSNFVFFTKLSMFFYHQGSGKELQTKFIVLVRSLGTLFFGVDNASRLPFTFAPGILTSLIGMLFRGGTQHGRRRVR